MCAVSCESVATARAIRVVNGANCLCLGEAVVSEELGCQMAEAFVTAEFQAAEGVPPEVLEFWKEARDELLEKGEAVAFEREIETM